MLGSNSTLEQSYALFGLNPSASIEEIKTIYRQMAKQLHPDLNPNDPTARNRFYILNQAYQLLLSAGSVDRLLDVDASNNLDRSDRVGSVRVNYVVDIAHDPAIEFSPSE